MAEHDEAELKARAEDVWRAAAAYFEDVGDAGLYQNLAASFRQLAESSRFEGEAATGELDISDFFRSVGEGLVAAQEDLDDRTLEALRKPRPHGAPSVYRIPKVTAEIQFALRSTESKKFGVLLFREGKEEEAQRQHKVTFDIVAAPPPPDVLALAEQLNVGPVFVTDPRERDVVRQALQAAAGDDTVAGRKARRFVTRANFPKTLILGLEESWLCILPMSEGPNLDVLRVFQAGPAPRVRAEGAAKDEPPALPRRLHDVARILVEVSRQQEQGLKDLGSRARR